MFQLDLPSLTPIFKLTCLQDNHQKILNMEVVTTDTFLNIQQRNEDIETQHIQNQSWKHQQK